MPKKRLLFCFVAVLALSAYSIFGEVVLENARMRLVIDDNAVVKSLVGKAGGSGVSPSVNVAREPATGWTPVVLVGGGLSLRRNTEYACGNGEREGECGIVEL